MPCTTRSPVRIWRLIFLWRRLSSASSATLARLRDSSDLEFELALELNDDDSFYPDESDRARRILACATHNVDLHGWAVSVTPDLQGLAVSHGPYSVSLMFGKQVANYVEYGVTTWP